MAEQSVLTDEQYASIEQAAWAATMDKGKTLSDYSKQLARGIEQAVLAHASGVDLPDGGQP